MHVFTVWIVVQGAIKTSLGLQRGENLPFDGHNSYSTCRPAPKITIHIEMSSSIKIRLATFLWVGAECSEG